MKPAKCKEMMTKFKILNLLLVLLSYDATMTAQQVDRYLEVRGMAELDERPLVKCHSNAL